MLIIIPKERESTCTQSDVFRDVIVENDVNRSGGVAVGVCSDVFTIYKNKK